MSDSPEAETLIPPDPLAKAKNGNEPVSMDPGVLRQAEQAIEHMEDDYPAWAQQDIDGLKAALTAVRETPDEVSGAIAEIYRHALDLKGQGGGFGFDLITAVGDLLAKFMENRESLSEREYAIAQAHVDALQAVLRDEIKGDGSAVGAEIVDGLRKLIS